MKLKKKEKITCKTVREAKSSRKAIKKIDVRSWLSEKEAKTENLAANEEQRKAVLPRHNLLFQKHPQCYMQC